MEQRKSRGKTEVETAVLDVRGLREFLGRTVGLSSPWTKSNSVKLCIENKALTYSVSGQKILLPRAVSTLYKAIRQGKIPHRRLGGRILIPRRQLLAWLEGGQPAKDG